MLTVGDLAPEFEGRTSDGRHVRLSDFRGRTVVLYFYPKASSPGCTRESKQFAAHHPTFRSHQVEVVGVSVDSAVAQQRFKETCALPFPLLADESKEISRAYGVLGAFGLAKRVTFIIDGTGRVARIVDSFLPGPHVEQALRLVEAMPAAAAWESTAGSEPASGTGDYSRSK